MVAGVSFAIGCFIFAFTATPDVHWIGPCFGIVIMIGECLSLLSLSVELEKHSLIISEHSYHLYLQLHLVSIYA
jgi:hypothetical protein